MRGFFHLVLSLSKGEVGTPAMVTRQVLSSAPWYYGAMAPMGRPLDAGALMAPR